MNGNKFVRNFGLFFVFLGIAITFILIAAGLQTGRKMLIFMALFLALLFCGIGGFLASLGIRALKRIEVINDEGTVYTGKIFRLVPDHQMTINGASTLSLIVRYKDGGIIKEVAVRTSEADEALFPVGGTVSISILNGEAALVPGTVTDQKLPDEENLMNPDLDPKGMKSSAGVSCPGCGANLMVPYGMAAVCPYCGRKVRVDADGNIK